MKPDILTSYGYHEGDNDIDRYSPGLGDLCYQGSYSDLATRRDLGFPADRFEIFSMILQSRSKALGSVDPHINPIRQFDDSKDLSDWGYDQYHYSHSREFLSNIIDEKPFWEAVINDATLNQ